MRTAIVTGGGNGIGAVAAEVEGPAVHCDVSDEDAVTTAFATVADSPGEPTTLVDNAGFGRIVNISSISALG